MSIVKENLLKFLKSTELIVNSIDDDSSEGTPVYVLNLANPVSAVGSITTADGGLMKLVSSTVHVGGDNIEQFMEDCVEKEGVLYYKGPMHLDVSKPSAREVNGQTIITKPPRIWLTKVKFSRGGQQLRAKTQQNFNTLLNSMFGGGKVVNADVPIDTPKGEEKKGEEDKGKKEPIVVANKVK